MPLQKESNNTMQDETEVIGPMPSYLPVEAIQLDYSISAVPRNLILLKIGDKEDLHNVSGRIGVIHKGALLDYEINAEWHKSFQFHHKQTTRLGSDINSRPIIILCSSWVVVGDDTLLVLSTNCGYQFYNSDGIKLTVKFDYHVEEGGFGRAITSLDKKILIGNERGELLTMEYNSGVVFDLDIRAIHHAPITDMHVSHGVLVSGDAIGNLSCWTTNITPEMTFKTRTEECVTSCTIWKNYAIASYGSGLMRLYDMQRRKLLGKVYAHSRWIVAMDLAETTGLLLTIAEDDLIRIWQLYDNKTKMISMRTSIRIHNMVPVGARFINNSGTMLAVSNFASKEVYVYGQ